jgi:HD superfamily phosphohydrolase
MAKEDQSSNESLQFENSNSLDPAPIAPKPSRKSHRQELFLPVSGFVWLYPEEVSIVNHPAFQRLSRIYQLGQSHLVFRGATHKRLEHVLGALHIVQRMIAAVETNADKSEGDVRWGTSLSDHEKRFVRLGTLLHDIGHMAAGHTIEDELELVSKHDEDRRLDILLKGEWLDRDGNTLGKLIDDNYEQYLPIELRQQNVSPSDVVRLLIRKHPKGKDHYAHVKRALESSTSIRLQICRDMIGNTICADLLDYIHRDWYHVGKPRPFDDRLLQYMEIRRAEGAPNLAGPQATDKFVISLGRRPKIRTDAISNILDLLEWRYSLAETVLFHRTKLSATSMLDRALYELWGASDNEDDIVTFVLPLSDEELISKCRERALGMQKETKNSKDKREAGRVAASLLKSLEDRQLFTGLSTRFAGDLPGDVVVAIRAKYARDSKDPKAAARNRSSALRTLEDDFGLTRGSLAMYCPAGMNRKIAEVQIAVGDEIERFCDYEKKYDNQLAGGHLDAQLRRFDRLWRVHFFIDRRVKESLGQRLYLLQQAIDKLVLGNLVDDEDPNRIAASLAKLLVQTEGSPWRGQNISDTPLAAKFQTSIAPERYPMGAASIRAFIY